MLNQLHVVLQLLNVTLMQLLLHLLRLFILLHLLLTDGQLPRQLVDLHLKGLLVASHVFVRLGHCSLQLLYFLLFP